MICQYDLLKNKSLLPCLGIVKEIDIPAKRKFNGAQTVYLLNEEFKVKDFDSEHAYIVAYDDAYHILGIYNISIGSFNSCDMYNRNVGIFLMLTGANKFCVFHNHPNGELIASNEDRTKIISLQTVGQILGVEFYGSFIITSDGWLEMDKGVYFYDEYTL